MARCRRRISCDVAIVGSGAGAGITAELLAKAGLKVVIVEEGPLKSSADFNAAGGRCLSVPLPGERGTQDRRQGDQHPAGPLRRGLHHRQLDEFVPHARADAELLARALRPGRISITTRLAPYFAQAERRLQHQPWLTPPNENNDLLRRGAAKLGIGAAAIARNVKGCWNLGSCGMGCPTNAKQSMLVTTIPAALDRRRDAAGRRPVPSVSHLANGNVRALLCGPVQAERRCGHVRAPVTISIVARHYVLAAGAINSPAVLLRSEAPDPHGRLGLRTFLHPVVMSAGVMEQKVEGWQGAPQTIYTDHFLETQPIDGAHRLQAGSPAAASGDLSPPASPGFGREQAELLRNFPQHACAAGAAARRFPPRFAGRQGQACAAMARPCSTIH